MLTGYLRPMPKVLAAYPGTPVTDPRPLLCTPCGTAFSAMQMMPPKRKSKTTSRCDGPPPSRCCGMCETEFDERQFEGMSPPRCTETSIGCSKAQWAHESCYHAGSLAYEKFKSLKGQRTTPLEHPENEVELDHMHAWYSAKTLEVELAQVHIALVKSSRSEAQAMQASPPKFS